MNKQKNTMCSVFTNQFKTKTSCSIAIITTNLKIPCSLPPLPRHQSVTNPAPLYSGVFFSLSYAVLMLPMFILLGFVCCRDARGLYQMFFFLHIPFYVFRRFVSILTSFNLVVVNWTKRRQCSLLLCALAFLCLLDAMHRGLDFSQEPPRHAHSVYYNGIALFSAHTSVSSIWCRM